MITIKILSVGKTKESWCEEALAEYQKRLSAVARIEFLWYRDENALEQAILKEKYIVLLDPQGHAVDSFEFTELLFTHITAARSRLAFAIGGPDGFSQKIKINQQLLSLSKMTFTHQMTRLILVEQIFRAFEIRKGSAYHK
jgi:23S rRNA (pseudouridine1915-N3)-methyltransferase